MTAVMHETFTPEMVSFGKELLAAAQRYEGSPFTPHGLVVGCGSQRTKPACMDVGVSRNGFDCMGVIYRAASDVLGLEDTDWSWDIRHAPQAARLLTKLTVDWREELPIGTPMVYSHTEKGVSISAAHFGLYAGNSTVLHSRSSTRGESVSECVATDAVFAPWSSKRFNFAIDPLSIVEVAKDHN